MTLSTSLFLVYEDPSTSLAPPCDGMHLHEEKHRVGKSENTKVIEVARNR